MVRHPENRKHRRAITSFADQSARTGSGQTAALQPCDVFAMHPLLELLRVVLRGRSGPRAIRAAVGLGIVAGATCGLNLVTVAAMATFLTLNLPATWFITAAVLTTAASWLLSVHVASVGEFLLARLYLDTILAWLPDGPLTALAGLDRHAVVGGLATGAVAAILVDRLLLRFRLRRRPITIEAGHDSIWRIQPRTRPLGIPLALVAVAATTWCAWSIQARRVQRELLVLLSDFSQSHVTAGYVHIALGRGEIDLRDVQFPDPNNLGRDRLVVSHLVARLDPAQLVRGQFHAQSVQLIGMKQNVARRRSAAPWPANAFTPQTRQVLAGIYDPQAMPLESIIKLDGHAFTRLDWISAISSSVERLHAWEACSEATGAGQLSTARGGPDTGLPLVWLKHVRIDEDSTGLGPRSVVDMFDLRCQRGENDPPASMRVVVPALHAELSLDFHRSCITGPHRLRARAYELPLDQLVDPSQPLAIAGGQGSLLLEGELTLGRLQLAAQIEATQLMARWDGRGGLAGLKRDLWNAGLSRIDTLRVDGRLTGEIIHPRFTLDGPRLAEHFLYQLRANGEDEVLAACQEHLARSAELTATSPVVASNPDVLAKTKLDSETVRTAALATEPQPTAPAAASDPPANGGFAIAQDPAPLKARSSAAPASGTKSSTDRLATVQESLRKSGARQSPRAIARASGIRYPRTSAVDEELPVIRRGSPAGEQAAEDYLPKITSPAYQAALAAGGWNTRPPVVGNARASDTALNARQPSARSSLANRGGGSGRAVRSGQPGNGLPGMIGMETGYAYDRADAGNLTVNFTSAASTRRPLATGRAVGGIYANNELRPPADPLMTDPAADAELPRPRRGVGEWSRDMARKVTGLFRRGETENTPPADFEEPAATIPADTPLQARRPADDNETPWYQRRFH